MSNVGRSPSTSQEQTTYKQVGEKLNTVLKTNQLLREIQSGKRTYGETAEKLQVSKSTIYNWTTELDLVEREDVVSVRLTTSGVYHLQLLDEIIQASGTIDRAREIISKIPHRHLPPWEYLSDVVVHDDTANIAGYKETYRDVLERARRIRVFGPEMFTPALEVSQCVLSERQVAVEYAFPTQVLAKIADNYPKL